MKLLVYVKDRFTFFKALFRCCFIVKVCQFHFAYVRKSAIFALVDCKLEVTIKLIFQSAFDILNFVQLVLFVRYDVVYLLDEIHRRRSIQLFIENLFLFLNNFSVFCALLDGVLLNWLIVFWLPFLICTLSVVSWSRHCNWSTRLRNYWL